MGRFPGGGNTQWRTDVFLSNHSSVAKVINVRFYLSDGSLWEGQYSLNPFQDVQLFDFVFTQTLRINAGGMLMLTTSSGSSFSARARIYNVGNPAGEFGQNVPGIGLSYLSRQAFLYGLSGVGEFRLNVGVANPSDKTISVDYVLRTANNQILTSGTLSVGPFQVIQINDVFTTWNVFTPANASIEFFTTGDRIYGYASEVRNDTGDAIFVFGQSPNA